MKRAAKRIPKAKPETKAKAEPKAKPAEGQTAVPAKKAPARAKKVAEPKSGDAIAAMRAVVIACLEDAKAEEIVAITLDAKSALADEMVIASGRSNRHVAAIADQLVDKLRAAGLTGIRVEGTPQCDWVLVDSGPVIIHLFRPEVRSFYNLEKLWSANAPHEQAAS